MTGPSAFGKTPAHLQQNSTVGKTMIRGVGSGATFALASCTSSSPTIVPCQVWDNQPPHDAVRLWCLNVTPLAGVTILLQYIPFAPRTPVPSTTLTVHCKLPRTPSVPTPGNKFSFPLSVNGPAYTVTSCTTNVVGTNCNFAGEQINKICQLTATVNTLPVLVTATVTLAGPGAIQGQTIKYYYVCI